MCWDQPTDQLTGQTTAGMTNQPGSALAERRRQQDSVGGSVEAAATTTIKTKATTAARQQGGGGGQRCSRVVAIARQWQ